MRHTDLELYRWKFHNTIYTPSVARYKYRSSASMWWREHGAFISILPRQCGKTTRFIKTLVTEFERKGEHYMIVVPKNGMVKSLQNVTGIDPSHITSITSMYNDCLNGTMTGQINLLIDEFMYIDEVRRNMLLENDWKTVTMISSLK